MPDTDTLESAVWEKYPGSGQWLWHVIDRETFGPLHYGWAQTLEKAEADAAKELARLRAQRAAGG